MTDGTVISISANSSVNLAHVKFEPIDQTGSLMLDVIKGTLRIITGALGKSQPENVKIKTPTATIGVRGTDFIVEVKP